MAMDKKPAENATDLRTKAEQKVSSAQDVPSETDAKRLFHELQVHQVELEMQNEELYLTKLDLEAARDSYFNLYDLAPVGYLTLDKDGVIQMANLTATKMLGFKKYDLLNKPIRKFIFRDDSDSYHLRSRSAIEASQDLHLELRLVHADGSPFWVNLSASPQDDNGLWIALTGIGDRKQLEQSLRRANDTLEEQVASRTEELATIVTRLRLEIEDHTRTEEALQASDRRFKALIRNSSDSITILDKNGLQIFVSDVVEKMLGYTPSELINIPVIEKMIHPDDQTLVRTAFEQLLLEGEIVVQYRHRHKNGSWVYLEAWGTNQLENPDIRGVVVNVRDITDRKKAEEEKLALEHAFQQAQKLESLGVLAGGIAHDFNNILAVIMGYCHLTKMNFETAETNIPEIEKAVERAAALCRQMLAYAGKASFEKARIDMRRVVDEMIRMLQATIAQNVAITPDFSADVPCVTGDASQIRQVVMNLIINAAEAIGNDQGEIRVSLSRKILKPEKPEKDYLGKIIPQGCYACLEVADTGCGMAEETYNRIFEPFYSTKFIGRGLGMSVVLGIIKTHDGALQLQSELGKGTTFTIFLPVQLSDSAGEDPLQGISTVPWQGGGTILLVEDDVQVMLIARTMLQKMGFTVLEASDGRHALQLFQENAATITLVVTDLGMPVMDGYELIAELKTLRPDLPIIISSGFGDGVVTSRLASGDVAGIISKPYRFEQLQDVLKRVLDGVQKQPWEK